ncbi:MAG: hypothetical protein JWM91_5313 [Rhodospirillales bacterium]|nr:hypothetical protein [Rhodospirillales bacterium]
MPAVFVEFTMGDGKAKIMIRAASVTSYFDLSVLALDKGAEPNANTRVTFGSGHQDVAETVPQVTKLLA